MPYSGPALSLRKPNVIELPRLGERISYIYLEYSQVHQDSTGVIATQGEGKNKETLVIPIASIGFLLMGPGTSISTPAAISLHRAGTIVIFSSLGGATGFAAATPLTGRGEWAHAIRDCGIVDFDGILLPVVKRLSNPSITVDVFPAYAGVFPRDVPFSSTRYCLPRVCGGVPRQKKSSRWSFSSSPRMRGCSYKDMQYKRLWPR